MDQLATEQDVIAAVSRHCPGVTDIKVGQFRPMAGNLLAITVTLPASAATALVREKHIRVGMVRCRVDLRVEVTRCFRCWAYDHIAKSCKGPDRRDRCFNCGEAGHASKACNRPQHCLLCDKRGHAPGTVKCATFRKALDEARATLPAQKPRRAEGSKDTEPMPKKGGTKGNDG